MNIQKNKYIADVLFKLVSSLSKKERKNIISKFLEEKEESIPISVFKADISGLEIIVKYLKEAENFSFKQISTILNRRLSTIYNTYSNAKSKFKGKFDISGISICVPFHIFSDRKYSILESIAAYLINKENLSIADISKLLNKNHSTIRTVYRRYKLKNAKSKHERK